MTKLPPPEPTDDLLRPHRMRVTEAAWEQERESRRRSIAIGLFCTLVFHVLLLVSAPFFQGYGGVPGGEQMLKPARERAFDIELANPETPPPPPINFVETNPEAPENTPDKTDNFSNRNQQSAQPEKAEQEDALRRPSVKGEENAPDNNSIVSGDMSRPQQEVAAAVASVLGQQNTTEQTIRKETVPEAGVEKFQGEDPDGVRSGSYDGEKKSTEAEKLAQGSAEGTGDADENRSAVSMPTPKPRPRLTQARPVLLKNRITGVRDMGVVGIDARWSEYGDYMQEFIEIVQASWYAILEESRVSPHSGTYVAVKFRLNSVGEIEVLGKEATAGEQGIYACLSALTARQPYRKWTDQMRAVLGDSQEMTFTFYYR